ncbi:MAG TPA: hypothetical protein VGB55_10085, partial [Tepidisphaeraceae bacterium]
MLSVALPALIATSVGLAVFGVWRGAAAYFNNDERRLKDRLSNGVESRVQTSLAKSIRRRTGLDEVHGTLGKFE